MIFRTFFKKWIAIIIACLVVPVVPPNMVQAETVLNLPVPGAKVIRTKAYAPLMIRGINLHPEDPLKFDFIMDRGDTHLDNGAFQEHSTKLIKYFLAALTIPEEQMWVNLSPYEKDRIIPDAFGKTLMGRDLLAQDYLLKQITSTLMYPEEELGEEFWNRIYEKAHKEYGVIDLPMNTFNKVWIVPDVAEIYEHSNGVYVVDSHLKVMLEKDYLALDVNQNSEQHGLGSTKEKDLDELNEVSAKVIREVILPELEREVNQGKLFANLRQIFQTTILAKWYKEAIKESLLKVVYIDKNKMNGVDYEDKEVNQKIYEQYVASFNKGVFDYIKEEYEPQTQTVVVRNYFSGGVGLNKFESQRSNDFAMKTEEREVDVLQVTLNKVQGISQDRKDGDAAMLDLVSNEDLQNRLAEASVEMAKIIKESGMEHILLSGKSSPIAVRLFYQAWKKAYPQLTPPQYTVLPLIDGKKFDTTIAQTEGSEIFANFLNESLNEDAMDSLKRNKVFFMDDLSRSGGKLMLVQRLFKQRMNVEVAIGGIVITEDGMDTLHRIKDVGLISSVGRHGIVHSPLARSFVRFIEEYKIRGAEDNEIATTLDAIEKKIDGLSDEAMLTKGGIDLNSHALSLKVTRQGEGFISIPIDPTQLQDFEDIQGFTPVITNMNAAVPLPLLLGLEDEADKTKVTKKIMNIFKQNNS